MCYDEDNALKDQVHWQGFTAAPLNPLECVLAGTGTIKWPYLKISGIVPGNRYLQIE
jgi:hypothetical protein